jgi:leader peptidase (prepilin peptidase)/N-methyltransferase
MPWIAYIPYLFLVGVTFVFGLMVGSFLNVLIARLPYDKSIVWPSSRCFVCYNPIRLLDNVPILGYLRLGGRCRACGAGFSARYLWVEVGTGVAFAALFVFEILTQADNGPDFLRPWQHAPGLRFNFFDPGPALFRGLIYWAAHAFLLSMLIAASVIDLKHRIIPAEITYVGTLVGLVVSTVCPWPWPGPDPHIAAADWGKPAPFGPPIPVGIALWPFWGLTPGWAPPGTPLFGFLNGLIGAAVGMLVARMVRGLFGAGFGKESMGLGDADLLMMAGAFLGWQPVALALPVGAVVSLAVVAPVFIWTKLRGRPFDTAMPFGPGLAAGVVVGWLGWPWLGELIRTAFFDPLFLGMAGGVFGGGLLAFGFLLRRRGEPEPAEVG